MRSAVLLSFCFAVIFLCVSNLWADQTAQDVVYLKNGSIIRGMIIEQIPNQHLKIQTNDGSVYVYNIDEVERIAKEPPIFRAPSGHKKNPTLAFVLSFVVLPGAGQIYNGEPGKGVAQFIVAATGAAVAIRGSDLRDHNMALGGLALFLGGSLWSWIDAPASAQKINEERGYSQTKTPGYHLPTLSLSSLDTHTRGAAPKIEMSWRF